MYFIISGILLTKFIFTTEVNYEYSHKGDFTTEIISLFKKAIDKKIPPPGLCKKEDDDEINYYQSFIEVITIFDFCFSEYKKFLEQCFAIDNSLPQEEEREQIEKILMPIYNEFSKSENIYKKKEDEWRELHFPYFLNNSIVQPGEEKKIYIDIDNNNLAGRTFRYSIDCMMLRDKICFYIIDYFKTFDLRRNKKFLNVIIPLIKQDEKHIQNLYTFIHHLDKSEEFLLKEWKNYIK